MKALMGGPKLPPAPQPIQIPKADDPEVEDARRKAVILQKTASSRSATRLTSGLGVQGTSNTVRQTLGGV